MPGSASRSSGDGAPSRAARSTPSGIAVLVAGLVVLVFGLIATLASLGAETDEDVFERLAGQPAVGVDVAPVPSTAPPSPTAPTPGEASDDG